MSTRLGEPAFEELVKPTKEEANSKLEQRDDGEDAFTDTAEQHIVQGVKPEYPKPLKLALILTSLSLAVFLYGLVRYVLSGDHHGATRDCCKSCEKSRLTWATFSD